MESVQSKTRVQLEFEVSANGKLTLISQLPKGIKAVEIPIHKYVQYDDPMGQSNEAQNQVESCGFLTTDDYVNLLILSWVDEYTLFQLNLTNKYINKMCQLDELWRLKLSRFVPLKMGQCVTQLKNPRWATFILLNAKSDPIWSFDNAVTSGYAEIVEYLLDLHPKLMPNTSGINRAAVEGHINVIRILHPRNKLINLLPYDFFYDVAVNGHLEILKIISEIFPLFKPTLDFIKIEYIITEGHGNVLKWIIEKWYDSFNGRTIHRFFGLFAKHNNLEMLDWFLDFNPKNLPNRLAVIEAVRNGHINILQRLTQLPKPIHLSGDGVSVAAMSGHLSVLEYAVQRYGTDILNDVTFEPFYMILKNGHTPIFKFLFEHGPKHMFNGIVAIHAAKYKNIEALDMLAQIGILPDVNSINMAKTQENWEIINWLSINCPPPKPPIRSYWMVSKS